MMRVEVTKNDRVGGVECMEDGFDVEDVTGGARGCRRNIRVYDIDRGTIKFNVDGDYFEGGVGVGDGGRVDVSEGRRVMN